MRSETIINIITTTKKNTIGEFYLQALELNIAVFWVVTRFLDVSEAPINMAIALLKEITCIFETQNLTNDQNFSHLILFYVSGTVILKLFRCKLWGVPSWRNTKFNYIQDSGMMNNTHCLGHNVQKAYEC